VPIRYYHTPGTGRKGRCRSLPIRTPRPPLERSTGLVCHVLMLYGTVLSGLPFPGRSGRALHGSLYTLQSVPDALFGSGSDRRDADRPDPPFLLVSLRLRVSVPSPRREVMPAPQHCYDVLR
jgi:hypothetical protein